MLEGEGAQRDWVGFPADRTPEDALAGDRLVQQDTENIGAEVRVRTLQRRQIGGGKQMEDEPVIALAEDIDGNATGLLGDEQRPQVVLTALLHPGKVRLCGGGALVEDGLRLFYHGNGRDGLRLGLGKLLLVAIKDAAQDQAGEDERLLAAHPRDIHDAAARLAFLRRSRRRDARGHAAAQRREPAGSHRPAWLPGTARRRDAGAGL